MSMQDSPNTVSTILLVDPQPVVRSGFRALISSDPHLEVIGEADSIEHASEILSTTTPDIMITEVTAMPGDCAGLIRDVVSGSRKPKILIFSDLESNTLVEHCLKAGAQGFVSKRCPTQYLLDAVHELQKGRPYVSVGNFAPGADPEQTGATKNSEPVKVLTQREFEVFRLLAEGNTVMEIAEQLSVSPNTAGVHQTRIMNKLNLKNSAQLARMAIRHRVVAP